VSNQIEPIDAFYSATEGIVALLKNLSKFAIKNKNKIVNEI
jgi:hypothetical protein